MSHVENVALAACRIPGSGEHGDADREELRVLEDEAVVGVGVARPDDGAEGMDFAAVEEGEEKLEDVEIWLDNALKPFFRNYSEEEFSFNAPVWILRRTD